MSEKLSTQTVSFKGMYTVDEKSSFIAPTSRHENLTTHQINTIQLKEAPAVQQQVSVEVNEPKPQKQSSIKKSNPYYEYIPRFYLKEMRNARLIFAGLLTLLIAVTVGIITLIVITFTTNLIDDYNPWILLLLIPLEAIIIAFTVVNGNRYRNFHNEARDINFKNDKVLSINVQKLYRRLKTGYVDLNWFCILTYVILLLMMLVDAIVVMWGPGDPGFGRFDIAAKNGNYTYSIIFWVSVVVILVTFIYHLSSIVLNYMRASNIENYYNYMIVDVNELNDIKKKKNRRDLFIFLTILLSVIFLIWFIVHLIRGKQKETKVVVK